VRRACGAIEATIESAVVSAIEHVERLRATETFRIFIVVDPNWPMFGVLLMRVIWCTFVLSGGGVVVAAL